MKFKPTFFFRIILFAAVFITLFVLEAHHASDPRPYVFIGDEIIYVEIADTPQKRGQGLSGRESLCEQCGMLFIFPEPAMPDFWMSNMNFPLDILWIKDRTVIGVVENLSPLADNAPPVYYRPKEPITASLELNAGWVKNHQVKIGDQIKFN